MNSPLLSVSRAITEKGRSYRAIQRGKDGVVAAVEQRQTLRPAVGEIGKHQTLQNGVLGAPAAVRHQIHLQAAGLRIVPILKRTHRNLPLHQRAWLCRANAMDAALLAVGTQQAIRRGIADVQELRPLLGGQEEMAVPLQGVHQFG